MARRTIRRDELKTQSPLCVLLQTKAGGFKVVAKAIPYGARGKVFGLVVDENGQPVKVASEAEARALGCSVVKIPRRKGVPKRKFGNRELMYINEALAHRAIQLSKMRGHKGKIGFIKAKIVRKLFA